METFSALLALCVGIHRTPVNSPHKDQWRGALMFSLILAWINSWVNNREAGDLRCHWTHYDVTVMYYDDLQIDNVFVLTQVRHNDVHRQKCIIGLYDKSCLIRPQHSTYYNTLMSGLKNIQVYERALGLQCILVFSAKRYSIIIIANNCRQQMYYCRGQAT